MQLSDLRVTPQQTRSYINPEYLPSSDPTLDVSLNPTCRTLHSNIDSTPASRNPTLEPTKNPTPQPMKTPTSNPIRLDCVYYVMELCPILYSGLALYLFLFIHFSACNIVWLLLGIILAINAMHNFFFYSYSYSCSFYLYSVPHFKLKYFVYLSLFFSAPTNFIYTWTSVRQVLTWPLI